MYEKLSQVVIILADNPWLIVLSSLFTLLSVGLAILLFFKSKKVKKPKFAIRSLNLIRDSAEKIEGLKILYLDNPIPNVTITKLAFWNQGKDTINGEDIAPANPLLIKVEHDYKILEYKIIYIKKESNQVKLREIENGKQVAIDFDYLDYGEGAVIQILHTGNSSKDISFSGTIKGVGDVNNKKASVKRSSSFNRALLKTIYNTKAIGKAAMIVGIVLSIIVTFLPQEVLILKDDGMNPKIPLLIACITYIFLGFTISRRQVPKGFEIFEDNI
jgi:hypothetical protein